MGCPRTLSVPGLTPLLVILAPLVHAGEGSPAPRVFDVVARIVIEGNGKAHTAAVPVPIDWPEQTVELIESEETNGRSRIEKVDGGAMLIFASKPIPAGESAVCRQHYRVTVRPVVLPTSLPTAKPTDRALQTYLRPSPGIESDDDRVKELANSTADEGQNAWKQVKGIFDWVTGHIEYREMDFTSAAQALESRVGDCEERASLFIAMCRSQGIPARTVWTPGHCWAEFHLCDESGQGQWLPAHTAGEPWFGHMPLPQVILQKGDRFRVPQKKTGTTRLLSPWLRGPIPEPKWEHELTVKEDR